MLLAWSEPGYLPTFECSAHLSKAPMRFEACEERVNSRHLVVAKYSRCISLIRAIRILVAQFWIEYLENAISTGSYYDVPFWRRLPLRPANTDWFVDGFDWIVARPGVNQHNCFSTLGFTPVFIIFLFSNGNLWISEASEAGCDPALRSEHLINCC